MKTIMKTFFVIAAVTQLTWAHVGEMPSIHDTVAKILTRMKLEMSAEQVKALNRENVVAFLNEEEKNILSTGFLTFTIDRDADLYLAVDPGNRAPFWLEDQGFVRVDIRFTSTRDGFFELWKKHVTQGVVGLGVNSVYGGGKHYVAFLKASSIVKVSDIYPGQHRAVEADNDVALYVDRDSKIENLPKELKGTTLIQTARANRDAAELIGVLMLTKHVSTQAPDQVVLSWADDPQTTQTITWRTDATIKEALVKYQEERLTNSFNAQKPIVVRATTKALVRGDVVNDPNNNRHTVTITNLKPGTTYLYSVGDKSDTNWTALQEFTTAPAGTLPFSFMYIGDAQNGLYRWGSLMHTAHRMRPDISFIMMAGDLVNRGAQRDDWDDLFFNAAENYATQPLMPALGNHEYQGGFPQLYLDLLTLPTNGPDGIEPERAYYFEYSNALFISLDSNGNFAEQTVWLDSVLSNSTATWKFAMFHHPAYSSSPNRNNPEVQSQWVPLFDKYHVDMVLQGHDHAYLRTYPMNNHKPVETTKEGTVYVVSVSGVKMYEQGEFDYTAKGYTNTSTFQILDIQVVGDRLLYKSYNDEGKLVDEIEIRK